MEFKQFRDERLLKATLEAYAPYEVYADYILGKTDDCSVDAIAQIMVEKMRGIASNEYQKLAAQFINKELDVDDQTIHGVLGLTSEAGEVSGLFQKYYQGHEIDPEHLKKELGDCLWMIAEICTASGWDLSEIMAMNISKLKARYPNGFSAEKSLHRKDGDI